jgi:adenine/guanine/hypoxanthine permease
VVVALLFLLALCFAPLAAMIPACATAAALLYVARLMARGLTGLDWKDVTEYAPAVVAALAVPLTYSIANGIGFGFIAYALVRLFSGRVREISAAVVALAALFAVKFAIA